MVTSNVGFELARVTVVNYYGETVYDSFVMLPNKIENYNTKYSEIKPETLQGVSNNLKEVQEELKGLHFRGLHSGGSLLGKRLEAPENYSCKIMETRVFCSCGPRRQRPL